MTRPQLLLVAHGTRNPRGVDMIASLADAVAGRVGPTRVAFVDVLGPSPAEVLRDSSRPTVLVPAFLASGYHVHSDVPQEVAASGHTAVSVTRALGPDPILAQVLVQRLEAAIDGIDRAIRFYGPRISGIHKDQSSIVIASPDRRRQRVQQRSDGFHIAQEFIVARSKIEQLLFDTADVA